MKKIALILGLIAFWVSTTFANLGETAAQNTWRHNTEPIKMVMINDDPALKLHLLIYHEYGAFYIELIGADTVVAETVYCDQNSVEPPESVFNRMKALYGEGQAWEELPHIDHAGHGQQTLYQRQDGMFGIRKIWWTNKEGMARYDSFVQVGKAQIIAGLQKIDELNWMFKLD